MCKELWKPGKEKLLFKKQYIKEKNQAHHKVQVLIQAT